MDDNEESIEEKRKRDAYALAALIYDICREKQNNLGEQSEVLE